MQQAYQQMYEVAINKQEVKFAQEFSGAYNGKVVFVKMAEKEGNKVWLYVEYINGEEDIIEATDFTPTWGLKYEFFRAMQVLGYKYKL